MLDHGVGTCIGRRQVSDTTPETDFTIAPKDRTSLPASACSCINITRRGRDGDWPPVVARYSPKLGRGGPWPVPLPAGYSLRSSHGFVGRKLERGVGGR